MESDLRSVLSVQQKRGEGFFLQTAECEIHRLPSDIDPPRDLKEVDSSETSLTLRWEKPQAKVGAYRLTYYSKDGRYEEVVIPETATTHVLSNLSPGMSYMITLTAERGHKRSAHVALSASTGG